MDAPFAQLRIFLQFANFVHGIQIHFSLGMLWSMTFVFESSDSLFNPSLEYGMHCSTSGLQVLADTLDVPSPQHAVVPPLTCVRQDSRSPQTSGSGRSCAWEAVTQRERLESCGAWSSAELDIADFGNFSQVQGGKFSPEADNDLAHGGGQASVGIFRCLCVGVNRPVMPCSSNRSTCDTEYAWPRPSLWLAPQASLRTGRPAGSTHRSFAQARENAA